MSKPTGRGGGNLQAPAGSNSSWVGPATFSPAAFSQGTLCYLPRLGLPPTPSARTCCLTSPGSLSLLHPALNLPRPLCLLPASSHAL